MLIPPLFSIVVINLNNAQGLRLTLDSVRLQTFREHEVIFVDGNSTDDSLKIAEEYSSIVTHQIVGQDNGIYNAMNIGIDKAEGKYILFLNSGDRLYDSSVLLSVFQLVNDSQVYPLVFGYAEINSEQDTWLFPPERFTSNPSLLDYWLTRREPNHQATFFPSSFCKNNRYDESLKIIADKKFKRCALSILAYQFLNKPVASFELGGTSNKIKNLKHVRQFISDYQRYYLIKNDKSIKDTFLFFTASTKIIFKFFAQKFIGESFWNLIKFMRNYPIA